MLIKPKTAVHKVDHALQGDRLDQRHQKDRQKLPGVAGDHLHAGVKLIERSIPARGGRGDILDIAQLMRQLHKEDNDGPHHVAADGQQDDRGDHDEVDQVAEDQQPDARLPDGIVYQPAVREPQRRASQHEG